MKKILLPILLLISFFAKAQVPALNDTVRYGSNLPVYTPQYNYGFYQGLRLPYSYNSALGKTDLLVTGKYLRTFYQSKTDTIRTPLLYSLTKGYGLLGFTFNNTANVILLIDTASVNSIVSKFRLTATVGLYYTKIAADARYYPLSTNPSNYLASPMTTLGDIIYGGASGVPTRLAGNITSAQKFLTQTGTGGTASAAPVYFDLFGSSNTWVGGQTFSGAASFADNIYYTVPGTGPIWLTNSGANLNKLLAPTSTGAARTWTLQDKTGTIALTNDNISEFTNDVGYSTLSANNTFSGSNTFSAGLTLGNNLMLNGGSTILQLNNTNGTPQSWWMGQDVGGTGDGIWYLYNQTATQFALKMSKTNNATFLGSVTAKSMGSTAVTFANLPVGIEGMLVTVTDSNTSTIGATIAGGGANHVLAYYNGTNWTVASK